MIEEFILLTDNPHPFLSLRGEERFRHFFLQILHSQVVGMTEIFSIKPVVTEVINQKFVSWEIEGGLIIHQFVHSEKETGLAQRVLMHTVTGMTHRTDGENHLQLRAQLLQKSQRLVPQRHDFLHIQTNPVELVVRNLVTVGNDKIARNELIAKRGAKSDKQIVGLFQEIRSLCQLFIDVLLESLEIIPGKTAMMGKTHPCVTVPEKIAILVKGVRSHEHPQGVVYGYGIKKHPERVGTDLKAVAFCQMQTIDIPIEKSKKIWKIRLLILNGMKENLRTNYLVTIFCPNI